jgi:V/A-type H+-transporting ATPase subunit F
MSDIAFIGERDTIWPFKALGNDVFFSDEHESLQQLVNQVLQQQFKIIFITEDAYENVRERMDSFAEESTPTITILPSLKGSRGVALQAIRDSARRAMGVEFI